MGGAITKLDAFRTKPQASYETPGGHLWVWRAPNNDILLGKLYMAACDDRRDFTVVQLEYNVTTQEVTYRSGITHHTAEFVAKNRDWIESCLIAHDLRYP